MLQVVSVAIVEAGSAHNMIPDSATFSGTFRAVRKNCFYELRKRIEEVIGRTSYLYKQIDLQLPHSVRKG